MVGLEFGLIIRMLISLSLFEWVTLADTLDTGKSECPCIDSAMWKILGINGTNDHCLRVELDSSVECYPPGFGLGKCDTHSSNLPPTCDGSAGNVPQFCSQKWCFVDPDICRESPIRYMSASKWLLDDYNSSSYYSFETCGSTPIDKPMVDVASVQNYLSGKTLKLGVAVPSYYPDHYILYENGSLDTTSTSYRNLSSGSVVRGAWIDYFEEVASRAGFTISWYPKTGGSAAGFSSSFTACVNDVSEGHLDACVGDYWVTEERIPLAPFLTPGIQDTFHVLYHEPTGTYLPWWNRALAFTAPFTAELWIVLVFSLLVTGFVYSSVDPNVNIKDSEDTVTGRTATFMRGGISHTFSACYELVAAFPDVERTREGFHFAPVNLVRIAWSIVAMFAVIMYSAGLIATLVNRKVVHDGITTMDECELQSCTICVPSVMVSTIQRITGMRVKIYHSTSSTDVFRDMYSDKCDLGLMIERRYNTMWHTGEFTESQVCSIKLGDPFASVATSQPVSLEYYQPLSYWTKVVAGAGSKYIFSKFDEYFVPPMCRSEDENEVSTLRLGLAEMSAPLGIYALLLLSSVTLAYARKNDEKPLNEREGEGAEDRNHNETAERRAGAQKATDPMSRYPHHDEVDMTVSFDDESSQDSA
jgi:hypothetical protein